MLIDTQIKSFLIPANLWMEGVPQDRLSHSKNKALDMLPSLDFPSRDAIAIEIRATRGIYLQNEQRRYTVCWERIQDIVIELSQIPNLLKRPVIWPKEVQVAEKTPRARAFLAINSWIIPWMQKFLVPNFPNAYARIPALFFPPEHAKPHFETYQLISKSPEIQKLFQRATRESSVPIGQPKLTSDECQGAFLLRLELLRVASNEGYGLVDVFEMA